MAFTFPLFRLKKVQGKKKRDTAIRDLEQVAKRKAAEAEGNLGAFDSAADGQDLVSGRDEDG